MYHIVSFIVVSGLWGGFMGIILPHHIITPFFTIINPFHVSISSSIISPSTISIFHASFFTHHITKKNHIHQPISCIHFTHHSSYHSSSPFFPTFISSKKNPHHHFSLSSHPSFEHPPKVSHRI